MPEVTNGSHFSSLIDTLAHFALRYFTPDSFAYKVAICSTFKSSWRPVYSVCFSFFDCFLAFPLYMVCVAVCISSGRTASMTYRHRVYPFPGRIINFETAMNAKVVGVCGRRVC